MNVSSHVDRRANFAQYRTYEWDRADALPNADPRLDKNPFFQDHMQGAVEKEMALKGFKRASRRPDLLIHYHATIAERIDVATLDREQRLDSCTSGNCVSESNEYDAATLVLDVIDAHTRKLVWRGWAQDRFDGVLDNPRSMGRKIDEAVKRMMKRLPTA